MQFVRDVALVVAFIGLVVNSGLDFRSGQGHLQTDLRQMNDTQIAPMKVSIEDLYQGMQQVGLRRNNVWVDEPVVFQSELDATTEPLAGITAAQLQTAVKMAWHDEDDDGVPDFDEKGNKVDICPQTGDDVGMNEKGCNDAQVRESCSWDADKSTIAEDKKSGLAVGVCKNADDPDKLLAFAWEWDRVEGQEKAVMDYSAPTPWEPPTPAKDNGTPPAETPPKDAPKQEPAKGERSTDPQLP